MAKCHLCGKVFLENLVTQDKEHATLGLLLVWEDFLRSLPIRDSRFMFATKEL